MICSNCNYSNTHQASYCVNCGAPQSELINDYADLASSGFWDYAGFWKRFMAYLIDSVIINLPFFLLFLITSDGSIENTSYKFSSTVIFFIYMILMESSSMQATLGKKIMGIQVVDLQGNRISIGRATVRRFSTILSGLLFSIGYMMAGWTRQKQALHDLIASTLVINV
ncbi:putative RDD family membrane protein YckC [Paenibacillus shirakamiensis]|uniref:RDD family membrane protein YckC n=1 Tax=Paenibacillus shirakamiensis TaxID=1265935 RepID=A0ABS4JHF8_9BACL|nr:RDD family protein [Paenibacillus shirakamiensis]MBP2001133.1 putative RDD family membrane protein YckC [Paenibacillus shirakamiensis]